MIIGNHNSNIDHRNDIKKGHKNCPSKIKSKSTKRNYKIKDSSSSLKIINQIIMTTTDKKIQFSY